MNKLIIFDLDGTIAESKQPISNGMAIRLAQLLAATRVAVISGGALAQFLTQVVDRLPSGANIANLYLLPTSGAALYEYKNGAWNKVYEERLSEKEIYAIESALREAMKETGLVDLSAPAWGERIENRGAEVTLSALGQRAPLSLKQKWDPDHRKREALHAAIVRRLPEFSVRIGGTTSIDVTREGVDKAYGVRKLCERLGIAEADALYIGDELRKNGNDEAVYKTGVPTKAVRNTAETAKIIEEMLAA